MALNTDYLLNKSSISKEEKEKTKKKTDEIIKKVNSGAYDFGVDEDYINSFLEDADKYISDTQSNPVSYEDNSSSASAVRQKAQTIKAYLNTHSNVPKDTKDRLLSYIESLERYSGNVVTSLYRMENYNNSRSGDADFYDYTNKYNNRETMASGKEGYQSYLSDKESRPSDEIGGEGWKAKVARASSYDSTLPLNNVTITVDNMRDDTSWKEPTEEWTQTERYIFGHLYKTDKAEAEKYAIAVNNAINKAKTQAESEEIRNNISANFGGAVGTAVSSILLSPSGGADFLYDLAEGVARGQITEKGYLSPYERSQVALEDVATELNQKGTVNENVPIIGGKGWGDVYQLGTSIGQSLATGYALGPVGTLISYFGSAAASGIDDARARGASDDQAIAYGVLAGLAEAIPEALSVEKLLKIGSSKTLKSLMLNILKQSGAEGIEEGVTSIINNFADNLVMGDFSNFNILVQDYMDGGMSEEDAKKQAWKDLAEGIAFDSLAGMVSGGVSGGIQTGLQTGINKINETAVNKELYRNYSGDLSMIQEAAEGRLKELGESDNVSGIAAILAKQAGGGVISSSEQKIIDNSTYGQRVANELNPENIRSGGYASEWTGKIGTEKLNADLYNIARETAGVKETTATDTEAPKAEQNAPKVSQEMAEPKVTSSETSSQTETETAVQGESQAVNEVKERYTIGSPTAQIEKVAATFENATKETPKQISAMFKKSGVSVETFVRGVGEAYRLGTYGYPISSMHEVKTVANSLPVGTKMQAYYLGRNNAEAANIAKAKAQQANVKRADISGEVIYEGDAQSKVNNEQQMSTIELIDKVLKDPTGMKYHLYASYIQEGDLVYTNKKGKTVVIKDGTRVYVNSNGEVVPAPNGIYNRADRSIWLDVNAGKGGWGIMLFTLAHELVHDMKVWSPEHFNTLVRITAEVFEKSGESFEAAVAKKYEQYKKTDPKTTLEIAQEEVVAETMSGIFKGEKTLAEFSAQVKKADQTLWEKIVSWFKDVIARINRAYKDVAPESDEAKLLLEQKKLFEKAQKVFAEGIVKAGENFRAAQKTETKTENETDDLVFALRDTVEETKDLVAIHNMQVSELERSLDLGGLPMPSIAVIKAKNGHTRYGDVSLVFPKSTIDPKVNSANKVYGGDAWTPSYPSVEYKAKEKVHSKIKDKYYELADKFGYDDVRPLYRYVSEMENELNRVGGEKALLEKLYNDTGMMQAYLLDTTGKKIETVQKETRTVLSEAEVERDEFFIKELGEDVVDNVFAPKNESPMSYRKKYWAEHGEKIEAAYSKFLSDVYGFSEEEIQNVVKDMKMMDYLKAIRDSALYRKNGKETVRTEADYTATEEAIKEAATGKDYKAWVDSLFKGIEEKSGIRNNAEAFTRTGNRRSWEALHWENNLENVVRVMKEQKNGDSFFAGNGVFALAAKDYSSIEEMKADSNRLKTASDEEYAQIKQNLQDRLTEVASSIKDPTERNSFIALDNAMECIAEAIRYSKTKSGILNSLKQYPHLNVTETAVNDIVAIVSDIANMPTEYFEAKPKRAIGFDEVARVILPDSTSDATKARLTDAGIAFTEYEAGNEQARLEALNSLEDVRFSLRDSEGNELSEQQQEHFKDSKVRDENGNLLAMYHGTPNGDFTVFRPGTYFTQNPEYAAVYQNPGASSLSVKRNANNPRTYAVYLNIKKPFDTRNPKERKIFMDEYYRKWGTGAPLADSGLPDWTDGMDLQEFIEEMEYDYDGLILDEGATGGYGEEVKSRGLSYVIFSPEQAKDIDNKNPTDDPDIRYNLREEVASFNSEEYNTVKVSRSISDRLLSEAMTWHADKVNEMFNIVLGGYAYKMSFDEEHNLTIHDVIEAINIHEREDYFDAHTERESFDRSNSGRRNDEDGDDFGFVEPGRRADAGNDGIHKGRTGTGRENNGRPDNESYFDSHEKKWKDFVDYFFEDGEMFYQERVDVSDKNRIAVLENKEDRIAEEVNKLEKAFGNLIREEFKKNIAPNEGLSERAEAVNRKAANRFMNEVGAMFQVPKNAREEHLLPIINDIIDKGPAISEQEGLIDKLYDTAYEHSEDYVVDTDPNGTYKDLRNYIRKTSVFVDAGTKADVGDYENFRKTNYGSLKLTSEAGALPLDGFYSEIAKIAPEFFSQTVDGAEQLYELSSFMKNRKRTESIGDYMTKGEYVEWADENLGKEIGKLFDDTVGNFLSEASRKEKERTKAAEIKGALESVKSAAQNYEKAQDYAHAEGFLAGQMEQGAKMAKEMRQKQEAFNRKAEGYEKAIAAKRKQIADIRANRDELLAKAKAEKQEAVERIRRDASERLEKKLAEAKAHERAKLTEVKDRSAEKQQAIRDKYRDSIKKATENRHRTAMRNKIKGVVSELNQMLNHQTKERHIPESMKAAVASALEILNLEDRTYYESRLRNLEERIKNATSTEESARLKIEYNKLLIRQDDMKQKFADLKAAYEEIKGTNETAYDPVVAGKIEAVADIIKDTNFRDMSMEQLEEVYSLYKMIRTVVRMENNLFLEQKAETISQAGQRVIGEVEHVGGNHPLRIKGAGKIGGFMWNNLKPIYAFMKLGSNTFEKLFNNVRAGEDTWAKDVSEAKDFFKQKSKKYNYNKWDMKKKYTFSSRTGQKFTLTLPQIMSLYAYSKRKQADVHLEKGGFVFDSNIEVVEKKHGIPVKYEVNTAAAYNIDRGTLLAIAGKLTAEQKAFVDEMQEYLSSTMGEKGNEVSMAMYDIRLFTEKNYFPLKSAKQFMFEQNQTAGEVKLKNSGFSKNTVPSASNPIILSDFMDVWANHVNDMSMYHAFVLPLEDFNRVFNYKTAASEDFDSKSVKQSIQNAYGIEANKYISELLKDLNGGARSDNTTGLMNKLIGGFKKASVFASASVVIQQPSAIVRATAIIGDKYFLGFPKLTNHKATWAEVKKYAPVAIIKEMGYFDTNMGRSTVDFIKDEKTIGSRMDDFFSWAPSYADETTWCAIWNAVKRETKAKNPGLNSKSEEFLKKAGERFTEVIVKTQVYDSVLSRSANMRSTDTGMKMATAFMAEPTTSINMLEDAVRQWKRGNKKQTTAQIAAVYGSIVLNAALVSLVYAARDDDDDENYIEKYLASLTSEIIDGFNPLTMIPFIKDAWSIAQGFDVERADMSLVTKLWEAFEKASTTIFEDTSDMDEEELTEHNKEVNEAIAGIADYVAALFGVPLKNIRRDINAALNLYSTIVNGPKSSVGSIADKVFDAVKNAVPIWGRIDKESKGDKLYDAIKAGDDVYADRLRESTSDSALRGALRDNDSRIREAALARINGDPATYMRIAKEIIADGFSQDDVVKAINAEINAINKGDDESTSGSKATGFFKTDDYISALIGGDQAAAQAVKNDIIATGVANGKTQEEAEKSFTTSFKSAVWDGYEDGELSKGQVSTMLTKYGDMEEEEVQLKFEVYEWKATVPGADDITASAIADYKEFAEPAGISKADYYKGWRIYCDTDADIDPKTGEGIAYSKVKKVMPQIDALPLTSAQKTALAKCWWAESTVRKYKTW